YRNKVLAHAAPGQLKDEFNERMARALLEGLAEILDHLDMLATRRLVYIAEVRQAYGLWLVQRYELVGEGARRIGSLELPRSDAARLPDAECVYLEEIVLRNGRGQPRNGSPQGAEAANLGRSPVSSLRNLHPLLLYDSEAEELLFLNARRGKR